MPSKLRGLSLLLLVVGAGSTLWTSYRFIQLEFPDVSRLKALYPTVIHQGTQRPPHVLLQKKRPQNWISLQEISRVAIGAIIVSEDWVFYQHQGYDPNQIRKAILEDWEEGRFARGASTITQQVIRNVFLEKDKNLWRKLKELFLATRLEKTVSKRKILESYVNIAEWGEGIYGIRHAAHHYLQKEPSYLSAKEGAFLAMLLPSPKRYSQSYRTGKLTQYARDTIESILRKMTQARYLTEEERNLEIQTPLLFELPIASAAL